MTEVVLKGLYAITPDIADTEWLLDAVRQVASGASALQYRNKCLPAAERLRQAGALRDLARELGLPFIVNDSVDLALEVDADGVHLGLGDGGLLSARDRMGSRILGASCYNEVGLAIAAEAAGADYVAFGAAYPSLTKRGTVQALPEIYREAKATVEIPVVAIGGITIDNARPLLENGVDMLAVIAGVFVADDIAERARQFAALFSA